MLGVRTQIGTIYPNDTAELYAALRINEEPVPYTDIFSVYFTVQRPDGTFTTQQGDVMSDGRGYLQWLDTSQVGQYLAAAQFTLLDDQIRTVLISFSVVNPFDPNIAAIDLVSSQVMLRLEDLYDSMNPGGPHLKDWTFAHFDQERIADFINEALMEINVQMPPTQTLLADYTTPNNDGSQNPMLMLLVQGVLVLAMRHLSRSYVEQPIPQGANIIWEDRTRYSQMWKEQADQLYQEWIGNVRLAKRVYYNFGHSALSIFSKAGRLGWGPSWKMRSIGRGWY